MMKKLKAIVVGVGHLGKHHARIYSGMRDVELVGVVDTDSSKADQIALAHGVKAYYDLESLPAEVRIASIVVPTKEHYNTAKYLIKRGLHCLIEKPMTETVLQASKLLGLAEKAGVILQVGHIERFNPAIQGLVKILKTPRFIECHRLSQYNPRGTDVGVVLDLMIHDLDIILYLVKSRIREIRAVGINVLTAQEDIANCRLEFENGCVANVTASRVSPDSMRKIRIFQNDAYLSLDYIAQEGTLHSKSGGAIKIEKITFTKDEPLKLELRSFVDCVLENKEPLVSGRQGYYALKTAHRIVSILTRHNARTAIR